MVKHLVVRACSNGWSVRRVFYATNYATQLRLEPHTDEVIGEYFGHVVPNPESSSWHELALFVLMEAPIR